MDSRRSPNKRFTFASSANVKHIRALPPLESYLVRVRGRQWQITDTYLETTPDGSEYFIPLADLLRTTHRPAGRFYNWPIHLAEKDWVDLGDFMSMFALALDLVAEPSADADILARTRGEIARYLHDLNDPTYRAALAASEEAASNESPYRLFSLEEILREPYVQPPGSILPLSPTELRARTWVPKRDDD